MPFRNYLLFRSRSFLVVKLTFSFSTTPHTVSWWRPDSRATKRTTHTILSTNSNLVIDEPAECGWLCWWRHWRALYSTWATGSMLTAPRRQWQIARSTRPQFISDSELVSSLLAVAIGRRRRWWRALLPFFSDCKSRDRPQTYQIQRSDVRCRGAARKAIELKEWLALDTASELQNWNQCTVISDGNHEVTSSWDLELYGLCIQMHVMHDANNCPHLLHIDE